MFCTTQCDWSSSSWLKSTITPAVIKGQKEYHTQLAHKIRTWIKEHPEDFPTEDNGDNDDDAWDEGEHEHDSSAEPISAKTMSDGHSKVHNEHLADHQIASGPAKTMPDYMSEVVENPIMMAIVGVMGLVIFYQWMLLRNCVG